MVVLHVASLQYSVFSGVAFVVPHHIKEQQKLIDVAFINVASTPFEGVENQFLYKKGFEISALPVPFCSPDLIVFHEVYNVHFLPLAIQARKANIPYIVVPHAALTKDAQKMKRLKKTIANLLFFNSFIRHAAAVQYLSEHEKNTSNFGKRKFVGTNGVYMPEERNTGSSETGVKLLYIGRLTMHMKGINLMLQAVGQTTDFLREQNAKLFLYGPDFKTRHADIREMVSQLHIEDLVVLQDKIFGDAKKQELLNSDIFIQASRAEGMPMGILEALSYGVPCLVTEGTNLSGIIEAYDAGWASETDADAIAKTIEKAINERGQWKNKSANAVKLIEENFLWSKVVENTLKEYQTILSSCNLND